MVELSAATSGAFRALAVSKLPFTAGSRATASLTATSGGDSYHPADTFAHGSVKVR
jgi:hypothetical protein